MVFPFTKAMDRQVEGQFRKDPSGRLVFLPFGRKGKAYFVDSKSEEEKVRAFVKMYRSASALISWAVNLGFYVWILSFNTGAHRWTAEVAIASSFFLFLLLLVWMLWSLYKGAIPSLTSSLREAGPDVIGQLRGISQRPRRLSLFFVTAFLLLIVLALFAFLASQDFPS